MYLITTQAARLFFRQTRLLLIFTSLLLTSSLSYAYAQAAVKSTDPAYVIHTTLAKITAFSSNSDKANATNLRGFIENEIIPHFDFNNMSHWITGRYSKNMTEQDKSDFQRSLRETFLSSLAKHLGSFDAKNTRIRFYPARYRGTAEAFVSTTIYQPGTPTVRLDFRMKRKGNDWKIIDVKANGSSAVLYYRRHFISQLRSYQRQNTRPR